MCQKCGKIQKCDCCYESPCSKCLDCFPVDYKVVRQEVKDDKCDTLAQHFSQIVGELANNKKGCYLTLKAEVEGTTVTVFASTANQGLTLEYSNNGVIFGNDNVFEEQPCGNRPYYVRIKEKPECVMNVVANITEGCNNCEPDWQPTNLPVECRPDNFEYILQYDGCETFEWINTGTPCIYCKSDFKDVIPTETRCYGGRVEILQLNNCGQPNWRRTNETCSGCSPQWQIVPSVDPKCISGFINNFESDGCGQTRWNPTTQNCSDCTPNWVTATPVYQECVGGTVRLRQVDGCGNTRMYNTLLPCGDIVTPCSPAVSLAGVPSQICLGDGAISIDGSSLIAGGGGGNYRWALVKTSDFNGVENLSWSTAKVWQVSDYVTPFRIYVSPVGADLSSPSCYAHINLTTIQCGGGGGVTPCSTNPVLTAVTSTTTTATLTVSGFGGVTDIVWRLKNLSGVIVKSGFAPISSNTVVVTYSGAAVPAGNYTMEIEATSCQSAVTGLPVTISGGGGGGGTIETEDASILGITKLGFSYDYPTHDSTIGVTGLNSSYTIRVEAVDTIPLTGKTWNGTTDEAPFTQFTYLINDTRYPNLTYSNLFRLNAVTDGLDAMQPGKKYKIYVENPAVPNYAFIKEILIPNNSISGFQEIPISGGGGSGNCQQGPTLISIISATPNNVTYQFNGIGIAQIRNRIKQGSTVISNTVSSPTSSTVTINLSTPLSQGTYTLEIQGESCTSPVSTPQSFVISGGGGGGTIIEPVIQTSADGVFVTTRGSEVYYMNHGINTIMKVLNTGRVKIEQQNGSPVPKTKTAINGTANLIILKNEKSMEADDVDKFIGPEGDYLAKDNFTVYVCYWGTVLTRESLQRRQHTPWQSFTRPESAPYFAGENEYCQVSRHDL